jgi:hypothetical protein
VSSFWLTGYYFPYSAVYGSLLAVVQIAGELLLTSRRWWLAGALLLLPLMGNIVLIDVFYGVDLGGPFMAVVVLAGLFVLLAPYAGDVPGFVRGSDSAGPERLLRSRARPPFALKRLRIERHREGAEERAGVVPAPAAGTRARRWTTSLRPTAPGGQIEAARRLSPWCRSTSPPGTAPHAYPFSQGRPS